MVAPLPLLFHTLSAYWVSDPPSHSHILPELPHLLDSASIQKKWTSLAISPAHIWLPRLFPRSLILTPRGLMRRWELLSRSSLPVLFFCLIGVLSVTINSFLPQLQAALICCHREKSNVQFHSHRAGNHRLLCQLWIFPLTLFFLTFCFFYFTSCCDLKQNWLLRVCQVYLIFPREW